MVKKTTDGKEMAAPVPSLKLSCMVHVHGGIPSSHDLWQAIICEKVSKKKDRLALSAIITAIPEDLLVILDAKKRAKENWEILWQRNLGVDRVIQSRLDGLKQDFEMLTMAKTDSIVDFAMKFTHNFSDLRNLGEVMEEKEVVR